MYSPGAMQPIAFHAAATTPFVHGTRGDPASRWLSSEIFRKVRSGSSAASGYRAPNPFGNDVFMKDRDPGTVLVNGIEYPVPF